MEGKVSQDESRRMVSEFFVKSLNVILGARIPSKYLQPATSSSAASASANKSFNLVLVNSPMRNKCHLSVVEPIVVDVLLLHHGSSACAAIEDQVFRWSPSQQTQQSQSLLERWVVHCVPWTCLKNSEKTTQSPDHITKNKTAATTAKKPPLSRRSVAAPPPSAEEKKNPWKKAMKMLSIMLRSLYNLTRLLPAYRIFQQLNSSSSRGSPGCCHFDLSYKVRSTLSVTGHGSSDKSLCKFNLTPVETELGRMCISVKYSDAASVERAIQRTNSIFSEIIQDYVGGGGGDGGGGSSGSSQNPHFAVKDRRICAATRTMSSNIPAAEVAAVAAVKRSYSSPMNPIELDQQQELVCPFACDDERKVSRDAAAGALITALVSAVPIEKSPPRDKCSRPTGTLREALRELRSYTDIARKKAVNI
ncbi:autophagy-related protein 13a [Selaginella moellendorffii]|uniref:autophagy-related protein 13a n=1 Tax=Selaginella moellendorffii TaxID=88036 RepID=UPI000D1C476E|nr:autophagy-related protein 13a [Selaginella moellendorffii]|eukprot:XP_024545707.1 autophagy-related protein 13a [Selaginella moellendorffii]